jgi:ubiquinone biosynthesis protein UbiJ
MVTPPPPLSFFAGLFHRIGSRLQPPDWAVREFQRRMVLFLNHVLQQEPEARQRLVRQQGKVARFEWRAMSMMLVATPAGLLDLAPEGAVPELTLTITEGSPFGLARAAFGDGKPLVRIEGDVQFAAEVNWLVDHVRWDVEDDLARVIGDVPAHAIATAARRAGDALRRFVGGRSGKTHHGSAGAE